MTSSARTFRPLKIFNLQTLFSDFQNPSHDNFINRFPFTMGSSQVSPVNETSDENSIPSVRSPCQNHPVPESQEAAATSPRPCYSFFADFLSSKDNPDIRRAFVPSGHRGK
jgi:hypothetical protein